MSEEKICDKCHKPSKRYTDRGYENDVERERIEEINKSLDLCPSCHRIIPVFLRGSRSIAKLALSVIFKREKALWAFSWAKIPAHKYSGLIAKCLPLGMSQQAAG